MKKIIVLLALIGMIGGIPCPAFAEDASPVSSQIDNLSNVGITLPSSIDVKQGVLYTWQDHRIRNLTAVTLAETFPFANAPKWVNMLWDGWTIDPGWAYDNSAINTGALLLGREIGTLGNYLPINFPLKDIIKITAYPIGISADNITIKPEWKVASGGGIIKAQVKF